MVIIDNNGGFIFNKGIDLSETRTDYLQYIDDNSELGQKIISMMPYVKLIYENGLVVDCEEIEQTEQELTIEGQIADIQQLVVQQQYELELLKLGIDI